MRIFLTFLRLGLTAFGGPLAHLALMEEEWVNRRRVLTRERFLEWVGVTQLLPGPNSTEMALHLGYLEGGWRGFFAAGIGFVLPAAILVSLLAHGYPLLAAFPWALDALVGVRVMMLAVIAQALWRLKGSAIPDRFTLFTGLFAALFVSWGGHETLALAAAGAASLLRRRPGWTVRLAGAVLPAAAPAPSLTELFAYFTKTGSLLFGSGYVLFAFLHDDLVLRLRWLTAGQLYDAVFAGQITPGPLFTAATFVGYVLGGFGGALVSTVGIFLPAFVFAAVAIRGADRLRGSPLWREVLAGVVAASWGLLFALTLRMAADVLDDGTWALFSGIGLWALLRGWASPAVLMVCGAVLGALFAV